MRLHSFPPLDRLIVLASVWILCCGLSASLAPTASAAEPVESPGVPDWVGSDIGAPGKAGSIVDDGGTITLQGSGADIWRESDSFFFAHRAWDGDGEWIVQVMNLDRTDPWAKAGIMVREDLAESSPHVMVAMTPAKGATFLRRAQRDGMTVDDSHQSMRLVPGRRRAGFQQRGSTKPDADAAAVVATDLPRWIKLIRRGEVWSAYDSGDGTTWEWLGTERLKMAADVRVGLALSSHNNAALAVAQFSPFQARGVAATDSGARGTLTSGTGTGLRGSYFATRNHTGPSVVRVDAGVDFDWGVGGPVTGIGPDRFSVRWQGELEARFSEPYALHVVSDDRVRLWLNDDLIIDEWYEHAEAKSSAVVSLEAGKRYLLRLDFFENRGRALVKLLWSGPSTPLEVIPATQLYPEITDRDNDGLPDVWEVAEGLNPRDPADADAVAPGQKRSNRGEYRARFATALSDEAKSDLVEGWLHQDVGRVGLPGAARREGATWVVRGAGADIFANSDGFHFVYREWDGDGEIIARVETPTPTDPWAKAGLMIRESTEAEARHAFVALTPEHGVTFLHRHEDSAETLVDEGGDGVGPLWLKLVRRGSVFAAYRSIDGNDWKWIGTESLDLPRSVLFGIVVCSHDNSELGEGSFQQLRLARPGGSARQGLAPAGRGKGLAAEYFDQDSGARVRRLDSSINFDWGTGSPADGIGADRFAARWEGFVEPLTEGELALHLVTDDGARLWLDGQLLIDAWSDRAAMLSTAKVQVRAGRRYAVRIEFYERERDAVARLLWSSPEIPKQPIPQSQLFPPASGMVSGAVKSGGASGTELVSPGSGAESLSPEATREALATVPALADRLSQIATMAAVVTLNGASAVNRLGRWTPQGGDLTAADRRGALEYDLNLPASDAFLLEIEGASANSADPDTGFYLCTWIDGEYLGRTLLVTSPGQSGNARLLTPFLKGGPHRLRVLWDNARKGRSLTLQSLRLSGLNGVDTDHNGRKDWLESLLRRDHGIEARGSAEGRAISSLISPACLEGRGGFLSMMSLLADGASISPRVGLGNRWFAAVPLAPERETPVLASYQNGGYEESKRLVWEPFALLTAEPIRIRRGDSLLLTVSTAAADPQSTAIIRVGDATYQGSAELKVPHRFDTPGDFEIEGTLAQSDGTKRTRTVRVSVLAFEFKDRPAAWTGVARPWTCTGVANGVRIEADSRLRFEPSTKGETREGERHFQLLVDAPEPRVVLARAGEGGPILDQTSVEGFSVYSATKADLGIIETLPDGTQLIEMTTVVYPVLPQVRFGMQMVVGGVVFEDGTVLKQFGAVDLNALGEITTRFLRPARVRTSVCHRLKGWQGPVLVGEY